MQRLLKRFLLPCPRHERYEACITTLENTQDLSKIILAELLNSLQAQEQRRLMRQDDMVEGALISSHKTQSKFKFFINYPPYQHCGKHGHPAYKYWKRPDAQYKICKQLGHEVVICKSKFQKGETAAQEEEHLFLAICFSTKRSDFG